MILDNLFGQHGIEPPRQRIHLAHSASLMLTLVQQTDMLGVTPVSVVEDYPGRDLLKVLPIDFEARLPPYGLITRRHRIQSSAMQAFIHSVKAGPAQPLNSR